MNSIKKILTLSTLVALVATALPLSRAEARNEGTALLAAGAGALIGASIVANSRAAHHHAHHHHVYHVPQNRYQLQQMQQQQTMNYVLMNYNPAFHDTWVRYVIVDCSGILTPMQQEQLIHSINQRSHTHVPVGSR